MQVKVISEAGYDEALLGISLSFNSDIERMPARAERLATLDGGHNKFLESMVVYLDIDAPRYWWSQFDTYRIGVTKQSESTMHTLFKRAVTADDFEDEIHTFFLHHLNYLIAKGDLVGAKAHLPESFLQRRIVCTNYKALRGVVAQRSNHKLPQWQVLVKALKEQLAYPHYLD